MAAVRREFIEQAVLLGEQRSLVGIIARPRAAARAPRPIIVILNTGIVHRVGHHRMYVILARALAARGHTVVRFDFAGIGDSAPRRGHLLPLIASLTDIKEVLDSLETMHHTSRFILVGLCSGADHAVLYSRTDPRVAGLVLMDPTMPPTARYYLHYVMQRLGHLGSWLSVAAGRSGLMRLLAAHLKNRVRPQGGLEGLTLQNLQFSPYLAECYRTAAERGIEMLSVFTSVSARQTYRDQILDAFPKISAHESLRLEFFEDSDHVFSADEDRARLVRLIADWLGPGGGADEPAARP